MAETPFQFRWPKLPQGVSGHKLVRELNASMAQLTNDFAVRLQMADSHSRTVSVDTTYAAGFRVKGTGITRFESSFTALPAGSTGTAVELGVTVAEGPSVWGFDRTATTAARLNFAGLTLYFYTIAGAVFGSPRLVISSTGAADFQGNTVTMGQLNATVINGTAFTATNLLTLTGGGDNTLFLNGLLSNYVRWSTVGLGLPTFTTRSVGSKLVLYPAVAPASADYAIGIVGATMWFGLDVTTSAFKWYAGTTLAATLTGLGTLTLVGALLSISSTAGLGYGTGAGGTVTQLTSKATAFTLSTVTGQITTAADALAGGASVSATWTNTALAATDIVTVNHVSGGTVGAYTFNVAAGAGTATLTIHNVTGGSLSEGLVLGFAVLKGVTA